jgi:hypothetical protein
MLLNVYTYYSKYARYFAQTSACALHLGSKNPLCLSAPNTLRTLAVG